MLDRITVDYYGTPTPLNQVGNITVPEARLIEIKPWESSLLKAIEKAINTSDLGINPSNDGKVIRLVFPELTEERRKELTKDVKKKGEESKVAIRNIRRDAVDVFKNRRRRANFLRTFLMTFLTKSRKLQINISLRSTKSRKQEQRRSFGLKILQPLIRGFLNKKDIWRIL